MAIKRTKNKTPLTTQLDSDLLARFREYVDARGETMTQALERAMRRDMAWPPPLPEPPKEPEPHPYQGDVK